MSYFKKDEAGPNHNRKKAKPNSESVNTSILQFTIIWDSLRISWAPPNALCHFFSSTLCSTHSMSSNVSSCLHYPTAAVLGIHLQKHCSLCCNGTSLSPIAPWLSSGIPATQQASAVFHDPFPPSKLIPHGCHSGPSSAASTRCNVGHFWNTTYMC